MAVALLPLAVACAPAAAPAPPVAPAQPAAPAPVPAAPAAPPVPDVKAIEAFYKGKTMRIVVGSAPGGGYDTYARLVARHMPRHIPGEPTMVVDNMPGAASLIAANHVYKVAEKDGTVIASVQGGLFVQQLLGLEGVEFDALKWQMLGAPASDRQTCVVTAKSGISTLADVMGSGAKQIVVGGNAPGSATWDTAMRLKEALGLNLKMVAGYSGTAPLRLSMDRGEVDGMCGWAWESVQATALDRVTAGDYRIIAQVTDEPISAKELEKVQMALSLAKTDEARQLIRLGIALPSKVLRPYMVAPEVPAQRAQALREAFAATLKDPEFRQEAEKAKLDVDPIPGEDLERAVRDLFSMPENIKAKLKQINEAG